MDKLTKIYFIFRIILCKYLHVGRIFQYSYIELPI